MPTGWPAACPPHHGRLPWRGDDPHRQAVGTGREEEVAPARRLQAGPLRVAQVEHLLQLGSFARPQCSEEVEGGIGRDDGPGLAAEEVARILGGEHQGAVVLPDPPRQGDDEPADGWILEEQAELVHDQQPAPVSSLDPRPQSLRQQVVDRRHHLVPQLAHPEHDQRCVQVDVGRPAEHPAEASPHPA